MDDCAKIENRLLLCVCLQDVLLDQLSCSEKVRPRQGAFCLSAAAVSSFIELEFIIQPFFCVMSSRAGGRWRGRERERKERGGPSNSTGVRTHWIVWSSWVARLFLAQSNSLALYWLHWWEEEASCFVPKGCEHALKATFGCLKPRGHVVSLRKNWSWWPLKVKSAFFIRSRRTGFSARHSMSTVTSLQRCFYPHCCSGLYSADSSCFWLTD